MALTPMSPGTLLDGRYHLDVLLAEHDGARFWRATDTVLARSVAVHIVSSDDPRAPRVLAAARSSAAVTDPHFLRVLDCSDVDGTTWVINEWGDGVSLDVMLARGTLPAMRAAWLTREVAEAIVAAHAQHLCHGRLNPEAVLVTESGAVKLIGFLVNAAFERQPTPVTTSPYGPVDQREADVIDLAGILYAALTGKWPGIAPSALPPAPKEGNRPLRPRQVRAGVPRTLDAICDRVLHKEAFQHSMPIETALEIAAALSDFVGDPTLVAPVDAPSMHDEPEPPERLDPSETAVGLPIALAAEEPTSRQNLRSQ
jgi:serine/threonine protein kinase